MTIDILSYIIVLGELLLCMGIFAIRIPHRDRFYLRISICLIATVCLVVAASFLLLFLSRVEPFWKSYQIWAVSAHFFLIFIICGLGIFICFECDFWGALFCATSGYCVQHIGGRISSFVTNAITENVSEIAWLTQYILPVVFCVLTAFLIYRLLVVRSFHRNTEIIVDKKIQIVIVLCVVIVLIVYNTFGLQYARKVLILEEQSGREPTLGFAIRTFTYIMSLIIAFITLLLAVNMYSNKNVIRERDALQMVINERNQQYEAEKANIELINIKCHDLKHQVFSLKSGLDNDAIQDIDSVIESHIGFIKTGNEALDVILTNKNIQCKSKNINFTYFIDGESILFMQAHDIYALFGNALDNAIEASESVDESSRAISVTEQKNGSFINIHIENYFDGKLQYAEGHFVTKKRSEGHGFGIKSMEFIAKKYGGKISVSTKENIFMLDIFLCSTL